MKRLLLVCGIGFVFFALTGVFGALWVAQQWSAPVTQEPMVFSVPKGATGRSLGVSLREAGLVKSPWVWRGLLLKRGRLNAKAGKHQLAKGSSLMQIADALEGQPLVEDEPFVVLEGWRLKETDAALALKGWAKPGEYIQAALSPTRFRAPFPLPARGLEGYLYPETYFFPPGSFTVDALIQRQLDLFAERFYVPHQEAIDKSGRSLEQLVLMASLLEREEPTPAQRPTVAGVLWKRFDAGTPLGVDATSRYLLDEWNDRSAFLKKLRDQTDPYNTRTKAGLPPTALGATTLASLLAALHPEKNPYWYYLHDASRQLHPSRNAAEHEALRAKYNVH